MLLFFSVSLAAYSDSVAQAKPAALAVAPEISARSAILIEYPSGRILFDKAMHDKLAPASTTKILTALLALENGNLDDVVTIQPRDLVRGTSMGLVAGEKQTLRNLLYGMMLPSGNDAAMAVARYIGSLPKVASTSNAVDPVATFVNLMNRRAAQSKLVDSHFANPHGLDAKNHYTSAYDLVSFTYLAMKNPLFRDIVKHSEYDVPGHHLKTLNKMLAQYPGAEGVKTGYTGRAGLCLVTAAERDGHTLISVVLNAPKWTDDSAALLDYGFARVAAWPKTSGMASPSVTPTVVATRATFNDFAPLKMTPWGFRGVRPYGCGLPRAAA
jgi:D-alanyl-D-alanine carboxypeptidase (penicillin-binding protein 5/6)